MKYRTLPADSTHMDQLRLFNEMWSIKPQGTMIIAKQSTLTGLCHFAELAITKEQVREYSNGTKVQHAFPSLSSDEREFILSGIVPEEWDVAFQDTE